MPMGFERFFMKIKKRFSIIELMTVILVVLLLMSLLIPTFTKLKMNARTALCKNQMRQLGILTTSYFSDHDGYLPDDLKSDIKPTAISNNEFYQGWNGHLLPYIDAGLKSYNRTSALRKSGNVYTYDYVYKKNTGTENPVDQLDGGWIVIKDAYEKGGFNELKTFICPEIHASTYDIGVSNSFNNLKVPRIDDLAKVFPANAWDFLGGGIPTTYLANDIFFGFNGAPKSSRMDEINTVSKKAFLVEGGLAWAKDTNGSPSYVYYSVKGGDLATNGISKPNTGIHKFNYVHDTTEPFWVMDRKLIHDSKDIATKFNNTFSSSASMVEAENWYDWCWYIIISRVDPSDKPFDKFFAANGIGAVNPFVAFDEPEYHYLVGNMNVLFGDGSVITKDQEWLSQNRNFIGQLTSE